MTTGFGEDPGPTQERPELMSWRAENLRIIAEYVKRLNLDPSNARKILSEWADVQMDHYLRSALSLVIDQATLSQFQQNVIWARALIRHDASANISAKYYKIFNAFLAPILNIWSARALKQLATQRPEESSKGTLKTLLDDYISECATYLELGEKVTRSTLSRHAGYSDNSSLYEWLAGKSAGGAFDRTIRRTLNKPHEQFVQEARKKGLLKLHRPAKVTTV